MKLTEEEKEVFRIHDKDLIYPPSFHVEEGLLELYQVDGNDHNLDVTLNYIKRMILEVAKKKNFNIDENESLTTKELLDDLVKPDKEILVGFDNSNYSDFQKLKSYFDSLTKDKSWNDIENIQKCFAYTHDGIRDYFASYIPDLISLSNELSYELSDEEEKEHTPFDDFPLPQESNDKIETIESVENTDFNDGFDFPDVDDDIEWNDSNTFDNVEVPVSVEKVEVITEDNLRKYLKFINSAVDLSKCHEIGIKIQNYLFNLVKQKKLEEFYSNPEFSKDYDLIMSHDRTKDVYYFHGTQTLEDAASILEQGFGMMRNDLSSTAYREFTKDELILYSRGFGGTIGRDAVVIIDDPIVDGKQKNIVEENNFETQINFSPSGLQGLDGKPNYIVKPENIVGYVNKKDKKVIFNPKYRNYKTITESANNSVVDNVIEQMAQGVDVLGENTNEMTQSNSRTMGFAKVGVLAIVTALISIGLLVLGVILSLFLAFSFSDTSFISVLDSSLY